MIYYFKVADTIHMLDIYSKNEKEDLGSEERKLVGELVQAIKKGIL